ncbi:Nitrilase [Tulasnella sp. 419]|nr:Nitrilase [Tulasnella sp. 419]
MVLHRKLKVAVIQACTVAYRLDETLDKLEQLVRQAASQDGSKLVVFPEAFIGGYPRYSNFGAVIGSRTSEGREEFLRYHQAAIVLDRNSPALLRLESISRDTSTFLILGVIEREERGGTLYCTVVFISPKHGLVGKHRKLQPTASERIVWARGDATDVNVVETSFDVPGSEDTQVTSETFRATISAAICWENYMPLLRTHYYHQKTEIYCAPTVDSRQVWQSTMTHIALEGRCFVLSACQFARQKDYPEDHPVDVDPLKARDPEAVMIGGGSVIVGPLGDILAGPLLDGEGILTAEIDLDDCIRGKLDLDVVGHYARNDLFELVVKTTS